MKCLSWTADFDIEFCKIKQKSKWGKEKTSIIVASYFSTLSTTQHIVRIELNNAISVLVSLCCEMPR